ncbi:MAG: murein DD-endopeptidase MepM/ murein hydrolase activator NlpD [Verrucomicrobiales bacterium]
MAILIPAFSTEAAPRPIGLVLPTKNRALFTPHESQYYMYTTRTFEGRSSKPWTGGKFGYVRNPIRTKDGIVYTKFHEGVDIRPHARDKSGNPLDKVHAISRGVVAYVSSISGRSNYGKYIVVEHDWGYGKFYSLYAHLMTTSVKQGQAVGPGSVLGRLGYTGSGIDRTRAHLHLEINMVINTGYKKWHDRHFNSPNYHGLYNGLNLVGIDVAGLYKAHKANPNITIPQFIARMTPYFRVVVPKTGRLEVLGNYPWLGRNMAQARNNPSWEISFSSSGVPLAVNPSRMEVKSPVVSWVKPSRVAHAYNTRRRLTGSGSTAQLTSSGLRYVQLIAGQF